MKEHALWAAHFGTQTGNVATVQPIPTHEENGLKCIVCNELRRVLDSASDGYKTARAAPFYLVSTEIAARMQVDMERARIAFGEHVSSCPSATLIHKAIAFAPLH